MSTQNNNAAENTGTTASPESNGDSTNEVQEGTQEARTFTQAELDEIVQKRLTREAAKFADYSDLKSKADQFDQLQAENATETEKAVNAAVSARETELRAEFAKTLVAKSIDAAAAGKFADVEDARLRLAGKTDEFVVNGSVDEDAIKDAVDALLTAHPHLRAQAEVQTPNAAQVGIAATGSSSKASNASLLGSFIENQLSKPVS